MDFLLNIARYLASLNGWEFIGLFLGSLLGIVWLFCVYVFLRAWLDAKGILKWKALYRKPEKTETAIIILMPH